jgi:hypothetical protein
MSEIKFDYGIQSNLPAQPESPAALGPKFLDTLDALSRIDPEIFTNWTIPVIPDAEWLIDQVERFGVAAAIKKTETYSLEAARPRVAAIVEKNVARDDFRQPDPTYGYSLVAHAGPAGEPLTCGFESAQDGALAEARG